MRFNNPSRFLKDIDGAYIETESGLSVGGSGRMPWDKPYTDSRWQNSSPVASQFKADPKPKITARKMPERAVDPLSERAKQRLMSEGGNFKRLSAAISNGDRQYAATSQTTASNAIVGEWTYSWSNH